MGFLGWGVRWNAVLSHNLGLSSLFYLPQVGALMFPTLSFSSSGYVMVCIFFFFFFFTSNRMGGLSIIFLYLLQLKERIIMIALYSEFLFFLDE